MTHTEIANWTAVYAATSICCAFAMLLSVATLAYELIRERTWSTIVDWRAALTFAPKLWWRWQKRYLMSTPVTLSIVGAFAARLDWMH